MEALWVLIRFGERVLQTLFFHVQYVPRPSPLDLSLYQGVTSLFSNRIICFTLIVVHLLFVIFAYFCVYWDRVDYFIHKRAIHINNIPAGSIDQLLFVQFLTSAHLTHPSLLIFQTFGKRRHVQILDHDLHELATERRHDRQSVCATARQFRLQHAQLLSAQSVQSVSTTVRLGRHQLVSGEHGQSAR